jgi:hypothetical protein
MASVLAHRYKSMLFQNLADFGSGKDPQITQRAPQPA